MANISLKARIVLAAGLALSAFAQTGTGQDTFEGVELGMEVIHSDDVTTSVATTAWRNETGKRQYQVRATPKRPSHGSPPIHRICRRTMKANRVVYPILIILLSTMMSVAAVPEKAANVNPVEVGSEAPDPMVTRSSGEKVERSEIIKGKTSRSQNGERFLIHLL